MRAAIFLMMFFLPAWSIADDYQLWKAPWNGKEYYKCRNHEGVKILTERLASCAGHQPEPKRLTVKPAQGEKPTVKLSEPATISPARASSPSIYAPPQAATQRGREIKVGPRGGRYYETSKGTKVYIPRGRSN